MSLAVANRYARALADVVGEQRGDYRQVCRELEDFAAAYGESPELREVFGAPAVPLAEKSKVLGAIVARLGSSRVSANFLRVVLTNYRMGLLPQICQAFGRIANERLGVVQVKVASAAALSETEQHALRARFIELTGKQVELEFQLDPELLGGIRAQVDSTVYDGSVRGQLERIRQQLVVE